MQINPGELNCRIAIQTNTKTADSTGDPVDSWADSKTAWAKFITTGGGLLYAAQKVNEETEGLFIIRYAAGTTTDNRIRFGSRYFTILSVTDVENRHAWMQISAKEVI